MQNIGSEKIYPEERNKVDRRQNNISVAVERRSGVDRRDSFEYLMHQNNCNKVDVYDSFRKQQPISVSPLSIVQPVDKIEDIHESVKKKNYFNAWVITALMLNSMPAYIKEFKNAIKDLAEENPKKEKLVPEGYYIKASFFRDTLFEPLLKIPYIGKYLRNIDKTLYDYKKIRKMMLITYGNKEKFKNTQIPDKVKGGMIKAYNLEGNKIVCFIGHSLMSISKLNLIIISALQIPVIYIALVDKNSKENRGIHGIKQIIKSSVTVPLAVLGGAMLGTLFHRKGSASTFLATGVGTYMGVKAGEYIEQKIDKI